MKYTPNIVSKNIITTYARKIRNVQSEQIDPYIKLIEKELIKVYHELKYFLSLQKNQFLHIS